jgi:integrase/recombinase XerD
VKDEVKIFLEYLSKEKDCSRNTLSAYQNDLSQLMTFAKENNITKLDGEFLKSYLLYLKSKSYSASTSARKIASAKSFFRYMAASGRSKDNPAQNLVSPQVNKKTPEYLSTEEFGRLLDECTKLNSPEARRDVVMLELLYSTGLRVSELVSLNIKSLNFEQSCVQVNRTHSKRSVPIDKDIVQLLKGFIANDRLDLLYDDKEQALFLNRRGGRLTRQGFWQILKNYAKKANLDGKVTPHTLRHSYAKRKLVSGMDLQSIQKILGHAYISSTRIYRKTTI